MGEEMVDMDHIVTSIQIIIHELCLSSLLFDQHYSVFYLLIKLDYALSH
jgi:hypothetical protein